MSTDNAYIALSAAIESRRSDDLQCECELRAQMLLVHLQSPKALLGRKSSSARGASSAAVYSDGPATVSASGRGGEPRDGAAMQCGAGGSGGVGTVTGLPAPQPGIFAHLCNRCRGTRATISNLVTCCPPPTLAAPAAMLLHLRTLTSMPEHYCLDPAYGTAGLNLYSGFPRCCFCSTLSCNLRLAVS